MNKYATQLLRYSIAFIFIIFGSLKFFPQLSPAETIGVDVIQKLTFNLLSENVSIYSLAFFEVFIGVFLLFKKFFKPAVCLAILHLIFTFTPFFILPETVVSKSNMSFTLLGQYILKNTIIIIALVSVYTSLNKKYN